MNTYTSKGAHDFKHVTRGFLFRHYHSGSKVHGLPKPKRVCLLPSGPMGDVERMLDPDFPTVSRNTPMTFIEMDHQTADVIREKSRKMGLTKADVETTEFQKFDFTSENQRKPYDLAYFDSCGQLTRDVFQWINRHRHALNSVQNLAFTFQASPRGNTFAYENFDKSVDWSKYVSTRPGASEAIIGRDIHSASNQCAFWTVVQTAIALGRFSLDGKRNSGFVVEDLFIYKESGRSKAMVYFSLRPSKAVGEDLFPTQNMKLDKRRDPNRVSKARTPKHKATKSLTYTPVKGGLRFIDSFYGWDIKELMDYKDGEEYQALTPAEKSQVTKVMRSYWENARKTR